MREGSPDRFRVGVFLKVHRKDLSRRSNCDVVLLTNVTGKGVLCLTDPMKL
jgi:hypothetical protein